MGPKNLSRDAQLQLVTTSISDLTNVSYQMNSEYSNGQFNPLNDLRLYINLYGYKTVFDALKNRIADAISRITLSEIISLETTPGTTLAANIATAEDHFRDRYLYLLYSKVFYAQVTKNSFYTYVVGGGGALTVTSVNSLRMWRTALSGIIAPGQGPKWYSDLLNYVSQ